MLCCFLQDCHHSRQAPSVRERQHIIENYELALIFGEHLGECKAGGKVDLLALAPRYTVK